MSSQACRSLSVPVVYELEADPKTIAGKFSQGHAFQTFWVCCAWHIIWATIVLRCCLTNQFDWLVVQTNQFLWGDVRLVGRQRVGWSRPCQVECVFRLASGHFQCSRARRR